MKKIATILSICFVVTGCNMQINDGNSQLCNLAELSPDFQLVYNKDTKPLAVVSDMMFNSRVHSGATRLIDKKEHTEAKELYAQRDRKKCNITLPDIKKVKTSTSGIYREHADSVMVISGIYKCNKCSKWHAGSASGFVITESGIAVTNAHVINGDQNKTFVAMNRKGEVFPVKEVLAYDKANDIAIIQLAGKGFNPIGIAKETEVGSDVAVISHPERRFYTLTKGIVSRYAMVPNHGHPVNRMYITADYAKGSSGAPVINSDGEVAGMVSSTQSIYYTEKNGQQQNLQMVMKLCVPASSILRLIEQK